jgi:hypothetical protein
MACAVTSGRQLPCKNSVGGLKTIFILPLDDTISALSDSAGTIDLATGGDFFQYDIKGNSSMETAVNSSRETGTTFYETTLNVTLTTLDVLSQEQLKLLNAGTHHIVVEDYNGNQFLLGHKNGCDVTGGTIVTGAAMGDLSGFTIVATAQETDPPYFVTNLQTAAAQVDPDA